MTAQKKPAKAKGRGKATAKTPATREKPEGVFDSVPVSGLRPHPRNARRGNVDAIRRSIRAHGFLSALVVQRSTGYVLAGSHRLAAARAEGLEAVPVIWADVDDETALRVLLADNRTSDVAGYDEEALLGLLRDVTVDLDATGFGVDDLDELARKVAPGMFPKEVDEDDAPPLSEDAVSVPGETYSLGPHRLRCGDSSDKQAIEDAVGGVRANAMWTDPPYGVDYKGGFNANKKRPSDLIVQNDALEGDALADLLRAVFSAAFEAMDEGSPVYICAPAGPLNLYFSMVCAEMRCWRQSLTWVKDNFALGRSDYHYRHEAIFYGSTPGAPRAWYGGRTQDTVLTAPKPHSSKIHPTMKPVELIRKCLLNSTREGDLVLDPFGGSGSTLIACQTVGRVAALVELDPRYCDAIRKRWGAFARAHNLDAGSGAL